MTLFANFPIRWIDNRRSRRVIELLAITWLLSGFDLCFTLWAQRFTPFTEMNPIADRMLQHGYFSGLVFYKLALLIFATTIFWCLRHRRSAELALWALLAVYVLLMFRWSFYTGQVAAAY